MIIPEQVRPAYEHWECFLEECVDFWLKTSDKHTKEHCKRVLLYCLLIADQKCLPAEEWDILSRVPQEPDTVLLYQIFKDADALDRFRLGPCGFDPKYLRTDEARNLTDYAKKVWESCCLAERGV